MSRIKLGCANLVLCYEDCESTSATEAEFTSCQLSCGAKAKSGSIAKYESTLDCGRKHCLADGDAGDGKCKLSADQTTLTNADGTPIDSTDPGTPPKECGACLTDALAALFALSCDPTASPDCNPAECTAVTNDCLSEQ